MKKRAAVDGRSLLSIVGQGQGWALRIEMFPFARGDSVVPNVPVATPLTTTHVESSGNGGPCNMSVPCGGLPLSWNEKWMFASGPAPMKVAPEV